MKSFLKPAGLAAGLLCLATVANAAPIHPVSVTVETGTGETTCTLQASVADPANICNALGAPDADLNAGTGFVDTGEFRSLLFDFGDLFGGTLSVWEAGTNASLASLSFTLQNSQTGQIATGILSSADGELDGSNRWVIMAKVAGLFDSLLITNESSISFARTTTQQPGLLLDAVALQPSQVPLPASAAFLLAGLGAFGAARRFRK